MFVLNCSENGNLIEGLFFFGRVGDWYRVYYGSRHFGVLSCEKSVYIGVLSQSLHPTLLKPSCLVIPLIDFFFAHALNATKQGKIGHLTSYC